MPTTFIPGIPASNRLASFTKLLLIDFSTGFSNQFTDIVARYENAAMPSATNAAEYALSSVNAATTAIAAAEKSNVPK